MSWEKIGRTVADAAPILGSLLAGPAGASVGKLFASVLGTKPEPEEVNKALLTDPDIYVKMSKLERDYEVELRELALEESKAILVDIQHARESHKDSIMPAILTFILMFLFASALYALVKTEISPSNRDILNVLIGNLAGWGGAAVAFYLGSMKGNGNGMPKK